MGGNDEMQRWMELFNKLIDNVNSSNEKYNRLESKVDAMKEEITNMRVSSAETKTQVNFWSSFWGLAGAVISVIVAVVVFLTKTKGGH